MCPLALQSIQNDTQKVDKITDHYIGTLSADRGAGDGRGCSDGASSEPGLGFRERVLGAAGGPFPG